MSSIRENFLRENRALERCPFPIPLGWFFVAYSDSLAPGEIRNVEMLDQEWVLFRGENGTVGLTDPYCPHLGAHLGHGGKVVGEHLRCPFHHWEYDGEGWCKHIPYGQKAPPITGMQPVLLTLPVVEKYGLIWAWYHPEGREPIWELPEIPEMCDPEYIKPARGRWPVNTAIQELAENGVDFPHLKFLHGNPEIPTADYHFDAHNYHVNMMNGYNIGHQCGPGLAIFRFTTHGITATMVSYTVPITREKSMMNMSFTHRRYPEGSAEAKVAEQMVKHMVGEAEGEQSAGFESVDMIVWNNKKYRQQPLLCDGDGPIRKYRTWFRQFYAESELNDKI